MNAERDDKNKKIENDKKQKETILKESTYALCPIHKVQYPRGASCPKC